MITLTNDNYDYGNEGPNYGDVNNYDYDLL